MSDPWERCHQCLRPARTETLGRVEYGCGAYYQRQSDEWGGKCNLAQWPYRTSKSPQKLDNDHTTS